MSETLDPVKKGKDKKTLEAKKQGKKEGKEGPPTIEIAKSRLLTELFSMQKGAEGHEYEVERRYKPKRLLSREELMQFSNGRHRKIEQCYVFVSDAQNQKKTVRLRRTSPEPEGELLRIAHKAKVEHNPAARDEYQIKFSKDDERAAEFETLWKQHTWEVMTKTRFYISYLLPTGRVCEIHYDIHEGGALDGFVRIEVEFKNDADEAVVREWQGSPVLPDWIREDVTRDKRYGSKALSRDGKPKALSKAA